VEQDWVVGAWRAGQRIRVIRDTVTVAYHKRGGDPVCQPDTRREQSLAHLHTEVCRHRTDSTDFHLVRIRVVPFEAAIPTRWNREVLPSCAERERQVLIDLPLVAPVKSILPVSCAIGRFRQGELANAVWQAKQEGRKAVELPPARPAFERSCSGPKMETAAGSKAGVARF